MTDGLTVTLVLSAERLARAEFHRTDAGDLFMTIDSFMLVGDDDNNLATLVADLAQRASDADNRIPRAP